MSPFSDSVAVATTGGIYSIDLIDPGAHHPPAFILHPVCCPEDACSLTATSSTAGRQAQGWGCDLCGFNLFPLSLQGAT